MDIRTEAKSRDKHSGSGKVQSERVKCPLMNEIDNYMVEIENLNDKSNWGGKREGAGRPVGSKDPETIEKEKVLAEMKSRIAKSAQHLLDSQMNLAQGVQMLYKIEKDEKGNNKKPELITSPQVIEDYLAGFYKGNNEEYYFITTERPDNKALDSLFDRTFGKATTNVDVDVTSGGESLMDYAQAQRVIARAANRIDSISGE